MEKQLRAYFTDDLSQPIVFHKMICNWPALLWTPSYLENLFGSEVLSFRIGSRLADDIQWETKCQYASASVKQFNEWTIDKCSSGNPLSAFPKSDYWCYADYKHMSEISVPRVDEFLSAVDWSTFGFEGRNSNNSTFWLGSSDANTVCHYDTYGYNLVAQIYGSKRWRLFPPSQTSSLYPTRIPYEESSVFSKVNIRRPNLVTHAKFNAAIYCDVTLLPGDVLFVPHRWWHFVENLETSISINTWMELENSDNRRRLEESVTRTLVCSIMSNADSSAKCDWINPTEQATDFNCNLNYIKQSLSPLCERNLSSCKRASSSTEISDLLVSDKRLRRDSQKEDSFLLPESSLCEHSSTDGMMCESDQQDVTVEREKYHECVSRKAAGATEGLTSHFSSSRYDHNKEQQSGSTITDCTQSMPCKNSGTCTSNTNSHLTTIVSPEFDDQFIQRVPLHTVKLCDEASRTSLDRPLRYECTEADTGRSEEITRSSSHVDEISFVDAVLHPDVITKICDILVLNSRPS